VEEIKVESGLKPKYCGRIYVRVNAELRVFMNINCRRSSSDSSKRFGISIAK
jgi:hypothetical protein